MSTGEHHYSRAFVIALAVGAVTAVVIAVASGSLAAAAPLLLPNENDTSLVLWPWPTDIECERQRVSARRADFALGVSGASSPLLERAVQRYATLLFVPARGGTVYAEGVPKFDGGPVVGALRRATITVKDTSERLDSRTDESYTLSVSATSGAATLAATTVFGAVRGLETLAQLLVASADDATTFTARVCTVRDAPRFAFRGFLVDTARHYLSMAVLEQHVDALAYAKMNVLHWHIVDSQSFPYESAALPELARKGAYAYPTHTYSAAQVAHVIAYAKDRGVRVVPEFDTPGHTRSWGAAYPALLTACYDKDSGKPNGRTGPLDVTRDATYATLKTFFDEVATRFADDYLHLGGDEVDFSCWASNPAVRAFMRERGFGDDYAKLESYYFTRFLKTLAGDGGAKKHYVVWQEVFVNNVTLPRDTTIVDVWKNRGWQHTIGAATAAGFQAVLSAPWYYNYIAYGPTWEADYLVEPTNFTGGRPELVIGGEGAMWGEFVDDTNAVARVWPWAGATAERLWSAKHVRSVPAAVPRLAALHCRLIARGIPAQPPAGPSYCITEWSPTYRKPWQN
eukprot:CAMPEP_0198312584 /NCGR_PEP_ID=MMETSP1450-20131203/3900_1 /TAXON_ID=753684 ORGANISM="Madagascaria erythrocladiodes, Strain CCMP3234" /NCGR_SAMPLE_ID=MMETSP1450 /ASSEMBLY_ACC=CAM_ASM_001115 /LENGTH=569 /DNA_ID=CAMNT_0044015535 /DNA_START=77 /DNA_END=1786 /DNA_ORIENTATION=-